MHNPLGAWRCQVAAALLLLGISSVLAEGSVSIHFQGGDRLHLSYASAWYDGEASELFQVAPDGGVISLDRVGEGGFGERLMRLADLASGTHRFFVRSFLAGGGTRDSVAVEVSLPASVAGTVRYDETFADVAALQFRDTMIPTGRRLTFERCPDLRTPEGSGVVVQGALIVRDCARPALDANLTGADASAIFTAIEGGTFFVKAGAPEALVRFDRCTGVVLYAWGGSLSLATSSFASLVTGVAFGFVDVTDCVFPPNTMSSVRWRCAPSGTLSIRNSEFFDDVVVQGDNAGTVLERNVFHRGLTIWLPGPDSPFPSVTANSFVGPKTVVVTDLQGNPAAFAARKYPLAGNYWGDYSGPRTLLPDGTQEPAGWLDGRSFCAHFDAGTSRLASGPDRVAAVPAPRPAPAVWVHGGLLGQVTLGDAYAREGREAAVCLDVRSSAASLPAAFELLVSGRSLAPESAPGLIKRDYGLSGARKKTSRDTVNFVIPAELVKPPAVNLEVRMQRLAGAGWPASESEPLWNGSLAVRSGFGRPLRLGVIAVDVNSVILSQLGRVQGSVNPIDLQALEQSLAQDLVSLWPLRDNDFTIERLNDYAYATPAATLTGLYNDLAIRLKTHVMLINASRQYPFDFVVAMVPYEIMEGAEGMSLALRRQIAFVRRGSPDAAIHELGHALGLYRWTEQYKYSARDNWGNRTITAEVEGKRSILGAVLENLTAFVSEELPRQARPPMFGSERFRHFPKYPYIHDLGRYYAVDIMGAPEKNQATWTISTTLRDVTEALYSLLGEAPAGNGQARQVGLASPRVNPPVNSTPPPGYRRVLFTGYHRKELIPQWGTEMRRLIGDSVWCRDVSRDGMALEDGFYDTGERFRMFNEQQDLVSLTEPTVRSPLGNFESVAPWSRVIDLPADIVRYQVFDVFGSTVRFDLKRLRPALANQLQVIAPGPDLGEQVRFEWSYDPVVPVGDAVTHRLFLSLDGGESWRPISGYLEGTNVTVATGAWAASANVAFRLVSADAFNSTESVATGFRLADRPPRVRIKWPFPNASGPTGSEWSLEALALDAEDGVLAVGEWRSDRDGLLATQTVATGVRLSAGKHRLTFTAHDTRGQSGSAAVDVAVLPPVQTDVTLPEEALALTLAGADPAASGLDRPQAGRPNLLSVAVPNAGIANGLRLSLSAGPVGGPARTLAEARYPEVDPFETVVVQAAWTPEPDQDSEIQAVVHSESVPDASLGNNIHTWRFTNAPPIAAPQIVRFVARRPVTFELSALDLDSDPVQFAIASPPQHGTLSGGERFYTYSGDGTAEEDQLEFTAQDRRGRSSDATVHFYRVPDETDLPAPPAFGEPVSLTGAVGEPFAHTFMAANRPSLIRVEGLPLGIILDGTSGVASGVPTVAGEFALRLIARNAGGLTLQTNRLIIAASIPGILSLSGFLGWEADLGADRDGDALVNAVELAIGGDPAAIEADPPLALERSGEQALVRFREFPGGTGTPGVDYTVAGVHCWLEITDHLEPPVVWHSGAEVVDVASIMRQDSGKGFEWVTLRLTPPWSSSSPFFVRLRFASP